MAKNSKNEIAMDCKPWRQKVKQMCNRYNESKWNELDDTFIVRQIEGKEGRPNQEDNRREQKTKEENRKPKKRTENQRREQKKRKTTEGQRRKGTNRSMSNLI